MELDEKVNELGYGSAFQLSLDCMRHPRGMATVEPGTQEGDSEKNPVSPSLAI